LKPSCGWKRIESGLPLGPKPKPFLVTFKQAGSFTYFCDVHAGMKGVVKVLPASKPIPTAKQDAAAVKAQIAKSVAVAKTLEATKPPAKTVSIGASGSSNVEIYGFFPSTLTVAAGTTVTFTMPKGSGEVHTATTGPGDPEKDPASYLGKIAASVQSPVFDPAAVYPSDAPPAPAALTPTLHGNGFWSTGALDTIAATPLPTSNQVTFAAPGTYQFYCMIHPFMHGTVVVQ
jgi:plastocyanin